MRAIVDASVTGRITSVSQSSESLAIAAANPSAPLMGYGPRDSLAANRAPAAKDRLKGEATWTFTPWRPNERTTARAARCSPSRTRTDGFMSHRKCHVERRHARFVEHRAEGGTSEP